jgi:outer membrane receptor for ferrienterochelin and colicin
MDIITKGYRILIGPQATIKFSKDFKLHAGGFYRFFNGEFWKEQDTALGQACRTLWNSRTSEWQAEAQGFLSAGNNNTVTFGGDLLRNSADFGAFINPATGLILPNSFSTKKAIVNGAGYIQDELKLFDCLNIIPVARLDYHSTFGSAFSPKLGISDKISDRLRLHASAGRSFRAPSLAELFLTDFPINEALSLKPNPDLKPEYIWGFDAGFDLTPINECAFKISSFYNSMSDLISQTIVSDPTTYVTHRNIATAWSQGIEIELEWRLHQWISLSTYGTIQDSRDETYHAPLDYVPKYMFGCQLGLSPIVASKKMEGRIGLNYVGKRSFLDFEHYENGKLVSTLEGLKYFPSSSPLSPYTTVDVSYKISLPKNIWLLVAAQNLFNVVYKETPGNLSPGRFATMKIGLDY